MRRSSLFRLSATVLALPLFATAAVSAMSGGGSRAVDMLVEFKQPARQSTASFRNHLVSIDQDGVVRGRVVAAADRGLTGLENMKVFFVRNGEIASQVYTRGDGSFEAIGLKEGVYSFVATGGKGFAAFGLRLTAEPNQLTNNLIEVGTASPRFEKVLEILGEKLPAQVVAGIVPVNETVPAPGANRVQLDGGNLVGSLTSFGASVAGATVSLVRNGEKVGETVADESGNFSVSDLEPGIYEFVATGGSGVAVLSFEAVEQDSVVSDGVASFDTAVPAQSMDVAMTAPGDQMIVNDQFGYACDSCNSVATYSEPYAYTGTSVGCGVAAGGCCGSAGNWGGYSSCCGGGGMGGAFGGGMGGLAGIAKFAILGWILTELFNEIDFSRPSPSSPSGT